MKKIKYIVTMILLLILIFTVSSSAFAQMESLLDRENQYSYLKGYENGKIYPDKSITRAEAVSLLSRILTVKPEEHKNYTCPYTDVSSKDWFYKQLGFFVSLGLIEGYPDGTFRPNDYLTRAEFTSMVMKLESPSNPSSEIEFSDVPQGFWGITAIINAKNKEWISGYPDGTFRPNVSITRAEVIVITTKMLKHELSEYEAINFEKEGFLDLTAQHWAYSYIMDAATGGYYYTIPVLMYHYIGEDVDCRPGGKYYGNNSVISRSEFQWQMNYLIKNGFETILVSELLEYLKAGKMPPKNSIVLTFDDGYDTDYTEAFFFLSKQDLKANFAPIVKSSEDASNPASPPPIGSPHVTFDHLREMSASGYAEIGSHSYDGHIFIPGNKNNLMDYFFVAKKYLHQENRVETTEEYKNRIQSDVHTSKKVLDQELNANTTFFVYPYGRYNRDLIHTIEKEGFQCGFIIGNKDVSIISNIYKLPRFAIGQNTTKIEFGNILK